MRHNAKQSGSGGRLRLGLLLASAAAFLLVPVGGASAHHEATEANAFIVGEGGGSGWIKGASEVEDGVPPIECHWDGASGEWDVGTSVAEGTGVPGLNECETIAEGNEGELHGVGVERDVDAGSEFGGWEVPQGSVVAGCTATSPTCHVLFPPIEIKATFNEEPETHALNLTTSGSGSGSFECDTGSGAEACQAEYADGTEVTVTPVEDTGSEFVEFNAENGGECSGATCTVTMSEPRSVNAQFDLEPAEPHLLTVEKTGTGTEDPRVISSPFGVNCGNHCAAEFEGTVTLNAYPYGSSFEGWTGCDAEPSARVCEVDLSSSDRLVQAEFSEKHSLTVEKTGTGTADPRVISSPFGINCGAHCSYEWTSATTVTLTAYPYGSTFVGWTGCDAQPSARVCEVELDEDKVVQAEFAERHSLTVTKEGAGAGTARVISTPHGINCGNFCVAQWTSGTTVTLDAYPYGTSFEGWEGCDAEPSARVCEVELTADKEVKATFE